jgi:hypothetical protein
LSGDTGKGVNVGRTSEMGFKRRCPGPPGPSPAGLIRGTAAERGAKNGFTSALLPALASAVSKWWDMDHSVSILHKEVGLK